MKKLIRSLKFAHAAEIAAYHAYEGHWRSVSNKVEQDYLKKIQLDELKHIHTLDKMLESFDQVSNPILDTLGKFVGEVIGYMCYVTGWRLPMIVAGIMEKIGTSSYDKIALEAAEAGRPNLANRLMKMAQNEQEHEEYFENIRKKK